jgi:hypothetical protein
MRHERTTPKAIVRRFNATADHPTYFRVVTWAPISKDRKLIGRYPSLEKADEAVLVDSPATITHGPDKDRLLGSSRPTPSAPTRRT